MSDTQMQLRELKKLFIGQIIVIMIMPLLKWERQGIGKAKNSKQYALIVDVEQQDTMGSSIFSMIHIVFILHDNTKLCISYPTQKTLNVLHRSWSGSALGWRPPRWCMLPGTLFPQNRIFRPMQFVLWSTIRPINQRIK